MSSSDYHPSATEEGNGGHVSEDGSERAEAMDSGVEDSDGDNSSDDGNVSDAGKDSGCLVHRCS